MDLFMLATIWTHTALQSEVNPWAGAGWRAVEAQHKNATMSLAHGNLQDQATLESILEEVKPILPKDTDGLHWLLFTPFRYPPKRGGSRFRSEGEPGVFYGAEDRKTACAEVGYWRWRFWMDSDGLRGQSKTVQLTLFEFHANTERGIDLTSPLLAASRVNWIDPVDYSHTQELAKQARLASIELIRYESVRNQGGMCLAILTPNMFRGVEAYRNNQQTWNLHIEPTSKVTWQRELGDEGFMFEFGMHVHRP
jgi:hypothetical protein